MAIELKDIERQVSSEEKVRAALEEIQKRHPEKLLVAADVVDAAAHPDHELHEWFEWEDSEAAHQYRLMQARCIIRKVRVSGPDPNAQPVPKYVSLRPDRQRVGGGYRETKDVINNGEWLAQLEETAKKDIEGVLNRYQMLEKLVAAVRAAIGTSTTNASTTKRRK